MQDRFVSLDTVEGKLQAEIIRGMLEARGIETILVQESAAAVYGLGVGPMAEVEILVPREQLEEARKMLQAYNMGTLEQDEITDEEDEGE
ncbi:MAG: DUF2007 domain-containing protein [Anaerolineales bacterium]|jgi:hypothetical protein